MYVFYAIKCSFNSDGSFTFCLKNKLKHRIGNTNVYHNNYYRKAL